MKTCGFWGNVASCFWLHYLVPLLAQGGTLALSPCHTGGSTHNPAVKLPRKWGEKKKCVGSFTDFSPDINWGREAISFFSFLFWMFIYFWERQTVWAEEGQRERETENPKQAPCCQHRAWCGVQTHEPQTMRSWPEPKSRVKCLTNWATQAPPKTTFF